MNLVELSDLHYRETQGFIKNLEMSLKQFDISGTYTVQWRQ
jgi:hypothetical protein